MGLEKVVAWLADEELYYRDHGDSHNSIMAYCAITLLKEQEGIIKTLEDKNAKLTLLVNDYLKKEREAKSVVRCKDCRYAEECIPPCDDRYCVFYDQRHDKDWFCADGVAKDINVPDKEGR